MAQRGRRAGNGPGADRSGRVGFAKQAKTTGGNGGEVVTVNTVADRKKYMEDDKARSEEDTTEHQAAM
ncbi:hypothetical protein EWW49_32100 [Pseudomonas syringae]|nr:hypothetical protein EWW49_32100 [Pseudomonas syringae]